MPPPDPNQQLQRVNMHNNYYNADDSHYDSNSLAQDPNVTQNNQNNQNSFNNQNVNNSNQFAQNQGNNDRMIYFF